MKMASYRIEKIQGKYNAKRAAQLKEWNESRGKEKDALVCIV